MINHGKVKVRRFIDPQAHHKVTIGVFAAELVALRYHRSQTELVKNSGIGGSPFAPKTDIFGARRHPHDFRALRAPKACTKMRP